MPAADSAARRSSARKSRSRVRYPGVSILARLVAISVYRLTSTSRKRPKASVIAVSIILGTGTASLIVDIAAPIRQAVAADLVAHRTQADSEQLSRARAVSLRGLQRHFKKLALHLAQRNSRAQLSVVQV